jgi:hypothetical protein
MVTKTPSAPGPLTREEKDVWLKAYLAAELPLAFAMTQDPTVQGLSHLCVDWAWTTLDAYRKAVRGERS